MAYGTTEAVPFPINISQEMREGWISGAAYNSSMQRPIRVDNSRPASVWDTARTLGVSKRRTEEIIREAGHRIHRDADTGEVVIEFMRKPAGKRSSRNGAKAYKKTSRRKTARR